MLFHLSYICEDHKIKLRIQSSVTNFFSLIFPGPKPFNPLGLSYYIKYLINYNFEFQHRMRNNVFLLKKNSHGRCQKILRVERIQIQKKQPIKSSILFTIVSGILITEGCVPSLNLASEIYDADCFNFFPLLMLKE